MQGKRLVLYMFFIVLFFGGMGVGFMRAVAELADSDPFRVTLIYRLPSWSIIPLMCIGLIGACGADSIENSPPQTLRSIKRAAGYGPTRIT